MDLSRRFLLSASLTAATALAPVRASAQEGRRIIGTWDLLSLYDENAGKEVDIFGANPSGRLTLDSARFFSFILLTDTPLISPACNRSAAPMTRDALGPGTVAYYGNYSLREPNIVAFHIERGLTGRWKHFDREAEFHLTDDKLSLVSSFRSLTGSDYSHLTWHRLCE
jgi:lipocalin-like protein